MNTEVSRSTIAKRPRVESAVYDLRDTCGLLNISYTVGHQMAQAGTFPITPIRIGRRYLFPRAAVDNLLGIKPCEARAIEDAV